MRKSLRGNVFDFAIESFFCYVRHEVHEFRGIVCPTRMQRFDGGKTEMLTKLPLHDGMNRLPFVAIRENLI
jgi:hypothetical protein